MKLFISYRRDDTRDLSALISDRLRRRYGKLNVFLDSGSIGAGCEWRKLLTRELHTCDVLIAVIGDDWLELRDDQGRRRIDNPEDEVRREIVTAFDLGIPVVPLLVSPKDSVMAQSEGAIVGLWEQRFFEAGRWNSGGIYKFYTDALGQLQIRPVSEPSNIQGGTNNHNVALDGSKFKTEGEVLTWNVDWGAYGIGSFRLEKKNANLYVGSAYEEDGREYRKNEFHRVIE